VGKVYSLLADLGLRTTKSVWPLRAVGTPRIGGATCQDHDYLQWVLGLQKQGFEIGYHNACNESSSRERTIQALDRFRQFFGCDPKTMANHSDNREGIYWGSARFTGMYQRFYNLVLRNKNNGYFRGHVEGDPLYWADICKQRIRYVRNFVFADINTLKMCPAMPYHDPDRPSVNYWYASSEGGNVTHYVKCLAEQDQDRLEEEGGACIMYTHFASGFCEEGVLDKRFVALMTRLSRKNGWFVPCSQLLDYLLCRKTESTIAPVQRSRMERRWFMRKIFTGTT
jgi:hypothetical protein